MISARLGIIGTARVDHARVTEPRQTFCQIQRNATWRLVCTIQEAAVERSLRGGSWQSAVGRGRGQSAVGILP
jgi:hypothetical protein